MPTSSDWLHVPSSDCVDFLRLTACGLPQIDCMWTSSHWMFVDSPKLTVCGLLQTECLLTSSDWLYVDILRLYVYFLRLTVCGLPQADCMWTSPGWLMWTYSGWLYVHIFRLTASGYILLAFIWPFTHIHPLIVGIKLHVIPLYSGSPNHTRNRSLLVCAIHIGVMIPQSRPFITRPNVSTYIYLCMLQTYYMYFQT